MSDLKNPVASPHAGVPLDRASQHRWRVVILLSLLAGISFIDKFIVSIIAQPLSLDLSLSDTQLGLLIGPAFAFLYALAGMPMAHFVDTRNRKRLVLFGVVLWSTMTALSGFVHGFWPLALMRSGVAMGEAVLAPAAFSMIADLFKADERATPVTIFMIATAAMGVGALAIGGGALMLATELSPHLGFAPWRLTLMMVGIPGLIVALLFYRLVNEPARRDGVSAKPEPADTPAFIRELGGKKAIYGGLLLSSAAFSFYCYSFLSWAPTILVRAHGFAPAQAGIVMGLTLTPITILSIYVWPRVAIRIDARRPGMGVPLCMVCATLISIIPFIVAPVLSSTSMFMVGAAGVSIVTGAWGTLTPLACQAISPSRMVARLTALNLLLTNLLGYGAGPVMTVALGQVWLRSGELGQLGGVDEPIAWGLASQGAIAIFVMLAATLVYTRATMAANAPASSRSGKFVRRAMSH